MPGPELGARDPARSVAPALDTQSSEKFQPKVICLTVGGRWEGWSPESGEGCVQRAHQEEGMQATRAQQVLETPVVWSWVGGGARRQADKAKQVSRGQIVRVSCDLSQIHLLEACWDHVLPML